MSLTYRAASRIVRIFVGLCALSSLQIAPQFIRQAGISSKCRLVEIVLNIRDVKLRCNAVKSGRQIINSVGGVTRRASFWGWIGSTITRCNAFCPSLLLCLLLPLALDLRALLYRAVGIFDHVVKHKTTDDN